MTNTSVNRKKEDRREERNAPNVFVKIRPLEASEKDKFDALTTDASDSGVALYTYRILEVGDKVEISFGGEPSAVGEISNINRSANNRFVRMGVRFLAKNDRWPL